MQTGIIVIIIVWAVWVVWITIDQTTLKNKFNKLLDELVEIKNPYRFEVGDVIYYAEYVHGPNEFSHSYTNFIKVKVMDRDRKILGHQYGFNEYTVAGEMFYSKVSEGALIKELPPVKQ